MALEERTTTPRPMDWLIYVFLASLLALGLAVFMLVPIAATVVFLMGDRGPPQFLGNYISSEEWNSRHWLDLSRKFNLFVQQQFPAGTSETALKSTLQREGFKFKSSPSRECVLQAEHRPVGVSVYCPDLSKYLEYRWGQTFCSRTAWVVWTTGDHGEITKITGRYNHACL